MRNMTPEPSLDRIDVGILAALQNDGRLSNKELAARVGLAPSSCLERVRKLRERGVLRGVHAEVDPDAMGVGIQAMVAVVMRDQSRAILEAFVADMVAAKEVVALYNLAGATDYLLHVMVRDTEHLRETVLEHLASRPEVRGYTTNLIFSHARSWEVPCYAKMPGDE
jgi:DNA-binding Lrp family transcriptional regulator